MSRAIPRVVCEALNLLEIRTEPPFWKLIDNRGRITLVLHWELPPNNRVRYVEPNAASAASAASAPATTSSTPPEFRIKTVPLHPNEEVVTLVSQDGTTVTTLKTRNSGGIPESARQHTSISGRHGPDECEFHCGSLHEEGRTIQGARTRSRPSSGASGGRAVRFHDTQPEAKISNSKTRATTKPESPLPPPPPEVSSESEVEPESTALDDDSGITSEKLLMLTDQLTADQRKHLTILDLGVILERLRAKIIDVERLEREPEGPTCFRWMIKATIRGQVLRDLGVLYNGNYYSISEHPGLAYAASGFQDDDDDDEDREDPL